MNSMSIKAAAGQTGQIIFALYALNTLYGISNTPIATLVIGIIRTKYQSLYLLINGRQCTSVNMRGKLQRKNRFGRLTV